MSAFIIMETTVRNIEARDRYTVLAEATLKDFGGIVLTAGTLTTLFGDNDFREGRVLQFPDKNSALAWFNSPSYQSLDPLRAEAIDCRFRIVG
jgi:uncharacterized protein (DUF1330 family)